jgi:hypothetical protein
MRQPQPRHLGGGLASAVHVEFGENAPHVVGDRVGADLEGLGHLGGRAAGADQHQDLQLAAGQAAGDRSLAVLGRHLAERRTQGRQPEPAAHQLVRAGPVQPQQAPRIERVMQADHMGDGPYAAQAGQQVQLVGRRGTNLHHGDIG